MAKFAFGYRCPECGEKFKWPQDEDPPDRCVLCHAWVSEEEPQEFVPKAPAIRKSAYAKSVDQTYREMERQSIDRADEAAGLLESQYSAQPSDEHDGLVRHFQKEELAQIKSELKITNMKDPSEMREGDTAVVSSAPSSPLVAQGAGFQPYGGAVSGANDDVVGFARSFTANHTPRAVGMIRKGNMGKY